MAIRITIVFPFLLVKSSLFYFIPLNLMPNNRIPMISQPAHAPPGHAFEGDVPRFIRQWAAQQRHGDLWGGVKDVLLHRYAPVPGWIHKFRRGENRSKTSAKRGDWSIKFLGFIRFCGFWWPSEVKAKPIWATWLCRVKEANHLLIWPGDFMRYVQPRGI